MPKGPKKPSTRPNKVVMNSVLRDGSLISRIILMSTLRFVNGFEPELCVINEYSITVCESGVENT